MLLEKALLKTVVYCGKMRSYSNREAERIDYGKAEKERYIFERMH